MAQMPLDRESLPCDIGSAFFCSSSAADSLAGCGPELSKNDLGTVVFEVPKVAGADQPYQMPQLGPPESGKGSTTV